MKRRGVKDTKCNRIFLSDLGFTFTANEKRKRIYIKVTRSDFVIINELLPDKTK